jgi:hypothetical protein
MVFTEPATVTTFSGRRQLEFVAEHDDFVCDESV